MDNVTRQLEIEEQRNKFRSIGIANFSINGMPEDESIAQYLDEKFSFFFALVQSPGHSSHSKLITWRLFSLSKKNPQIPMGYYGGKGFTFECYDGTAEKTSKEILRRLVSGCYAFSKREFDSFAMRKIESKENRLFYKNNEESRKYLVDHYVKMLNFK